MLTLIYSCNTEQSDINRGHRQFDRGNFNSAIKNYSWALESNPSNPDIYFFRGLAYLKKEKLDLALSDFSSAIKLDKTYLNAYINRGTIWQEKGKIDKALSDYNKVLELNPDNYRAYLVRADLYFEKKCFNNAISDYRIAIENNFDNATAHMGLSNVNYHEQNYESAIKNLEKAIEIDPNYSYAYNNLAWILSTCPDAKYRDGTMALKYAIKAKELNPSASNLHTYAASLAENNKFEQAINILEKSVKDMNYNNDAFNQHLEILKTHKPLRIFPEKIFVESEIPCEGEERDVHK